MLTLFYVGLAFRSFCTFTHWAHLFFFWSLGPDVVADWMGARLLFAAFYESGPVSLSPWAALICSTQFITAAHCCRDSQDVSPTNVKEKIAYFESGANSQSSEVSALFC